MSTTIETAHHDGQLMRRHQHWSSINQDSHGQNETSSDGRRDIRFDQAGQSLTSLDALDKMSDGRQGAPSDDATQRSNNRGASRDAVRSRYDRALAAGQLRDDRAPSIGQSRDDKVPSAGQSRDDRAPSAGQSQDDRAPFIGRPRDDRSLSGHAYHKAQDLIQHAYHKAQDLIQHAYRKDLIQHAYCKAQDLIRHEGVAAFQFLTLIFSIAAIVVDILSFRKTNLPTTQVVRLCFYLMVLLQLCRVSALLLDFAWRGPFLLKRRSKKCSRLQGNNVPTVDVLITTCNEDFEIIYDTLAAALVLDYPRGLHRIVVADDGNDPRLKALVKARQQQHENLYYFARHDKSNDGRILGRRRGRNPKAANINTTLEWLNTQGGQSEWFGVLDCDMIPEQDWLRALLSHAVANPRVGMVAPLQCWYNIPTNDLIFQSVEHQDILDESMKTLFGGAGCSGSGFLTRKSAIDSIGGFSETTLTEDTMTSLLLNGQGWQVIHVDEQLQWGLMPDSINGHLAQRRRWCVGGVQTSMQLKFCLDWKRLPSMSFFQRMQGFAHGMTPFLSVMARAAELALLPWCIVMIDPQLLCPTLAYLRCRLFLGFASRLSHLFLAFATTVDVDLRVLRQRTMGADWLAPMLATSILAEVFLGERHAFVSSGSITSNLKEREEHNRAPLRQRLSTGLFGPWYRQATFLALNAAVCFGICLHLDLRSMTSLSAEWVALRSRTLSPFTRWDEYVAFLIPMLYMAFPPTEPERRKLMRYETHTATWRARTEAKGVRYNGLILLLEMPAYLTVLWSGVVLCMA